MFDKTQSHSIRYISQQQSDGSYFWGVSSDSKSWHIPCKPNTTYTFSHNDDGTKLFRVGYINVDEEELPQNPGETVPIYSVIRGTTQKQLTITTGENATYLIVQLGATQSAITIETLQIEEGTHTTEYEPYVEPVTTNIYLDEPLRKIVEYADYIDFKNQKLVRYVEKLEDGTLQGLKTPIIQDIELPNILLGKGDNYISIDTKTKPSKVEFEYYK